MSDSKMVTEREAVIRERVAYLRGAASQAICSHKGPDCDMCRRTAALEYPLPKVTRPCVMTVLDAGGYEMRVVNGIPQYRYGPLAWADLSTFGAPRLTVNGARVLVALLANPTEEVEAES